MDDSSNHNSNSDLTEPVLDSSKPMTDEELAAWSVAFTREQEDLASKESARSLKEALAADAARRSRQLEDQASLESATSLEKALANRKAKKPAK